MELNFIETIAGKEWEAEFEATGDFNLHLERAKNGSLIVSQRGTSTGEYTAAFVKGVYEGAMVIDYDFGALVYPKWIKVTSGSEVVSASVNFNEGGGSGSGSGSGDKHVIYYAVKNPALLSGALPIANIKLKLVGGEIVFYPIFYIPEGTTVIAVAFMPVIMEQSINDGPVEYLRINSIEEFLEAIQSESDPVPNFSDIFIGRITEEEYWEHFNAE